MKKYLHLAVVFLCVIALSTLSLPLFSIEYAGQKITWWGWDLWSANFWNRGALIMPAIVVAVMYLPISMQLRRLFIVAMTVGFCVSYVSAISTIYSSLKIVSVYIRHHYGVVVYPQLILLVLLLTWIKEGDQ